MTPRRPDSRSDSPSRAGKWLAGAAAGTVGLVVTLEAFPGTSDTLLLPDPPLTDPAAVLVTAKPVDGSCPTFRTGGLYQLTDRVSLNENYTYGCAYSLTVFAVDNAVLVGNPENEWSDAIEEHTVGALAHPVTVELQVWNATTESDFNAVVDGDIKRANGVFRSQRTGVVLQRQPEIKRFTPRRPYAIKHDCNAVEDSLGFAIDPVRVNVVYLDSFVEIVGGEEIPNTASGYACTRHRKPPPVLILAYRHKNDLTLAHEIGHVLGHSFEEFPRSLGGHTDDRAGFDSTNLMWGSARVDPDPRLRFSLGQSFRVHLDSRSWVNRAQLRAGQLQLRCKDENKQGALIDSTINDGLEPCPRLITGEEKF